MSTISLTVSSSNHSALMSEHRPLDDRKKRNDAGLSHPTGARLHCRILLLALLCVPFLQAVDLTWVAGKFLNESRYQHSATLLPSGEVLVAGGTHLNDIIGSAEIYDPRTGLWRFTTHMIRGRYRHCAVLLASGKVLVIGGYTEGSYGDFGQRSTELYDPTTGTWSYSGYMASRRRDHVATLLPSGKVLVTGGVDQDEIPQSSAEIYDPVTGLCSAAGNMSSPRRHHTATALSDGRVLVVGGATSASPVAVTNQAEIYDPATNSWSLVPATMASPRVGHSSILMPNGQVMIIGGSPGSSGTYPLVTEIFQPQTNTWTSGAPLNIRRSFHTTTVLPSGRILVVYGSADGVSNSTIELYDPEIGSWTVITNTGSRYAHAATLLPSGNLLITGGTDGGSSGNVLSSTQFIGEERNVVTPGPAMTVPRESHTLTLLPDGKVLAVGGQAIALVPPENQYITLTTHRSAELLDPGTMTWSAAAVPASTHSSHTATMLTNGKVLICGSSAELYDPMTNVWSTAGTMQRVRYYHTATLLPSGKVLVTGGVDYVGSCELYDPQTNSWSASAPMNTSRSGHAAVLLKSGKVLVAGGRQASDSISSAEIYDPTTNTWTQTRSMGRARTHHSAALLPSGQVFMSGGEDQINKVLGTEIYDPATETWTFNVQNTGPHHSSTVLPSGKILITGGENVSGFISNQAAFFDPETGWRSATSLTVPRIRHTSVQLTSGAVLITGGGISGNETVASTELHSTTAWRFPQPVLNNVNVMADRFFCQGNNFVPTASGSGDASGSNRSAFPCVQWSPHNERSPQWLTLAGSYSNTETTVAIPPEAFGPGWLRVSVDGQFTNARFVQIPPPSVAISTSLSEVTDNGGSTSLTVTLSRSFLVPITVTLATSGTAQLGSDFTLSSTTITVPVGALTGTGTLTGKVGTPGDEVAIISITNAGLATIAGQPATITIRSSNLAPVLTGPARDLPPITGSSSTQSSSSVAELINGRITDPNSGDAQGVAITAISGAGTWEYTTDIGTTWLPLAGVQEGNARLLTDSGLVLIRYRPAAQTSEVATITYRAWDRTNGIPASTFDLNSTGVGGSSAFSQVSLTSAVTVTAFGPPQVMITGGATWQESSSTPVQLAPLAVCIDLDSPTMGGGTLLLTIVPGIPGDRLDYDGTLTNGTVLRVGSQVMLNGTTSLGTISGGGDGQPLTIAFTSSVTPALAQTLLNGLTFTNISGNPASTPSTSESRTLTVTVSDGQATSEPRQWALFVNPVDSPPVVTPLTLACVPGLTVTALIPATEPEGQALTYQLLGGQTKGDVTIYPNTGALTYRNTVLDGQDDSFVVRVTSGILTADATVSVRMSTPGRGSARFTSLPPLAWRDGVILSYTPTVSGFGTECEFSLHPALQVATTGQLVDPSTYTFNPATGTLTITSPTFPSGGYLRFGILAVDQATKDCAYQPVLLKILLAGDG